MEKYKKGLYMIALFILFLSIIGYYISKLIVEFKVLDVKTIAERIIIIVLIILFVIFALFTGRL